MRSFLLGVLILLLLWACAGGPPPEVKLSRAEALIEKGDYEAALAILLPLKEVMADDPRLWYQLGVVEIRLGRPYEALRSLETALELDRRDPRILVKLGYLYLVTGYYQKAEALAREIKAIDPENPYAQLILGNLKAFSGQLTQAESYFRDVLKREPKDFRCYLELGDFYLFRGDLARAENCYLKAKDLAPERPEVYMALGNLYRYRGDFQAAAAAFKKMILLAPSEKTARRYRAYLADFYLLAGYKERAFSIYEKLYQEGGPKDFDLAVRFAEVALHMGRLDEARQVIEDLSRSYPKSFAVAYLKGHLCLGEADYSGAVFAFSQAVSINEDERGLYYLGLSQWLAGYHKQAKATLARALEINPASYRARLLLAILETADGERTSLAANLLPLLEAPDLAKEAHSVLAVDLIRQGNCPLAEAEVEMFSRLYPDSQAAYLLRLASLLACGRERLARDEAIKRHRPPLEAFVLWAPEKALELQGQDWLSVSLTASGLLEAGRLREAALLLKLSEERLPLVYLRALVALFSGKRAEAAAALRRLVSEAPDFFPALALLGDLAREEGNLDLAIKYYRQALKFAPQEATVLNNLAWSLLEARGDLDEARLLAEKAASCRPQDPLILDTLGWIYYHLGMKEAARSYLQRALSLAPNDKVIKGHLRQLDGSL